MVGAPVPKARDTDSRIAAFHLGSANLIHGRSLGSIRRESRKAGKIIEVRHIARQDEEVKHVQGSRVIFFTRDTFAATIHRCTALLFLEDLENRVKIGFRLVSVYRRSRKAKTAGEGRRDKVARIAFVRYVRVHVILPLVARIHATSSAGCRNEPFSYSFVELLRVAITIPVIGPSGTPRGTCGVIIETNIIGYGCTRRRNRLMVAPTAPVSH